MELRKNEDKGAKETSALDYACPHIPSAKDERYMRTGKENDQVQRNVNKETTTQQS